MPQPVSRKDRWTVRTRVAVLKYAATHGLKPAATRFGLDRKTVREWRDRAKVAGEGGLVPRYQKRRPRRIPEATVHLIEYARREFGWGACRTRLWLLRVHQITVAAKTIARICEDLGLPRAQGAKPRRAPRQLKLFEKATPGESVQVDVKVVTVNGTRAYQYTACDDCTRYRVLRLFPQLNTRTSLEFLAELRRVLPFPIKKIQTDHGTEFSFAFWLAVLQAGMRHRYIKPRRPQQNGKVERSHRIDNEEFWGRHDAFTSFSEAATALRAWEVRYNTERFSMALQGRTPAEKLAALSAAA